MNVKESMFLGLAVALTVYGVISLVGHNYYTLMLQLYGYVFIAVLVALKARHGSLRNYVSNFKGQLFLLVDEEERKMKKLFTGEEYRVKNVEKVQ